MSEKIAKGKSETTAMLGNLAKKLKKDDALKGAIMISLYYVLAFRGAIISLYQLLD